ncbi:MAG TPA: hypothetical protein VGP85_21830, partial [Pyrinomonadaceae bacterium]|nr:hypothetical protein [Pyrinomonadaceae bacterium]
PSSAAPVDQNPLSFPSVLTKPGATKRPIARLLTETSLYRIVFNESNRIPIVLFIPDKAVKVIFHPELTAAV